MTDENNTEWQVASDLKTGFLTESDLKLVSVDIPALTDGHLVVKARFISVDPYLRGVLRRTPVGGVINSGTVAEVVHANTDSSYAVGDLIFDYLPWRLYSVAKESSPTLFKVPSGPPPSTALGVLGMPGMTAYFGLDRICQPKSGEVCLVTGAAGAVGSLVGQLAKRAGCFVIGTCGTAAKCAKVLGYGFDVALNYNEYKTMEAVQAAYKQVLPEGKTHIDCFFDNTGGHMSDAAFFMLAKFARVAICGQISTYNAVDTPMGPRLLSQLIYQSVTIRGFVVSEWMMDGKCVEEFRTSMQPLVLNNTIQYDETISQGFDQISSAFRGLFVGANTGKAVVQI